MVDVFQADTNLLLLWKLLLYLFWHWIWLDCDRPHDGVVAKAMFKTRAVSCYQPTIRKARKDEADNASQLFAAALSENRNREVCMVVCDQT